MASSSYSEMPEDGPIGLEDTMAMLIIPEEKISANERPFAREMILCNNAELRRWKEEVLDKLVDDKGQLPSAARVFYSWLLYQEGRAVRKFPELLAAGAMYIVPDATLAFWKHFFETKSITEMREYGAGTVSFGWRIVEAHMKHEVTKTMYEKFFSLSDDPLVWEKNHANHKFIQEHCDVLWPLEQLKEIREKVITILKIAVEPSLK